MSALDPVSTRVPREATRAPVLIPLGNIGPAAYYDRAHRARTTSWARLKNERERAGLTTAELAARAGIAPATLRAIEVGVQRPRLGTIRKLLTLHVQKERFAPGHLTRMVRRGHLAAVLKRLRALRQQSASRAS